MDDYSFDEASVSFHVTSATFDEASAAWRENKIARKGGAFSYKCSYIHSNAKLCKKPCVDIAQTLCKQHIRFGRLATRLNTSVDIPNKNNGTKPGAATIVAPAFARDK